jgi:hypothetical protein
MPLIKTYRAWFFDEKGEYLGKKGIPKKNKVFDYNDGKYNVDLENATYKDESVYLGLWKKRTFFYNVSNSNPIRLDKKSEPIINPELYKIQLETKLARDLNDLANKGGLSKFLTPFNILLGVAVIVVIYLLASGQIKL